MTILNSVTILTNGLTIAMSMAFLIIILWHDYQKPSNQFFAIFLIAVITWSAGSLLTLTASTITIVDQFVFVLVQLMEIGFTLASVATYALTATLVNIFLRRFRLLTLFSIVLLVAYQVLNLRARPGMVQLTDASTFYRFQNTSAAFYVIFGLTTLYLLWRYRARIESASLKVGLWGFVLGQSIGLLNPELQTLLISIVVSSVATLVISISLVRQEIINPLRERISQVESMHRMSLAITSQLAVNTAISQMANQASEWLNADGVGIFLKVDDYIRLVALDGLPSQLVNVTFPARSGVAAQVIESKKSIRLVNYANEWRSAPEIPFAKETFGSIACVPLVYGDEAIGALMVIAGRHSHVFQAEDVHLLELLGAQAAVAITNSRLFARQSMLTYEIEAARNQLETVLTSTENPVIAVNRELKLIFVNSAAERLFPELKNATGKSIAELLPDDLMPRDFHQVMRDIKRKRAHVFEVVIHERIYMSHLATLGPERQIEGWVAILNDVTELKELDRLKSEMVRLTSHDLKNPLQAAMANLDLLTDAIADGDTDEVQYSLDKIEHHLQRMHRLISGVLDMERLRKGSATFQKCHPDVIIANILSDLQSVANENDIRLTTEVAADTPAFYGDAGQFERALNNLVENAIKFTPKQGQVTIRVTYDAHELLFAVEDTGIGIPEEYQSRVFDSFFRANQRGAEHISGSGLGLHLVKTIVQQHQGKVWLQSEDHQGTTFFISLPIASDGIITGGTSLLR